MLLIGLQFSTIAGYRDLWIFEEPSPILTLKLLGSIYWYRPTVMIQQLLEYFKIINALTFICGILNLCHQIFLCFFPRKNYSLVLKIP